MSNLTLLPHQQKIIERLRQYSVTGRRLFDTPVLRSGIVGADHVCERTGTVIEHKLVNEVKAQDFSALERRVMRSAMFGVRYGKTWQRGASHSQNMRTFLNVPAAKDYEVPPRKTTLYYHVQSALLGW